VRVGKPRHLPPLGFGEKIMAKNRIEYSSKSYLKLISFYPA
jgi:hypothetical protein